VRVVLLRPAAPVPDPLAPPDDPAQQALRAFFVARRRQDVDAMKRTWQRFLELEWSRIRLVTARFASDALPGKRLDADGRDEVTQDTVQRILGKIDFAGTTVGQARAYVNTAAGFAFADYVRKHVERDKGLAGSLDDAGPEDDGPGLVAQRAQAEAADRRLDGFETTALRDAIERAFLRLMLCGHSAAEVAERLELTTDNVYQLNKRGLGQLRAALREDGY
jgi:DNA-directed RNA polymerase specialized sigma24 family protein